MTRIRVKIIGSGTQADPYRVDLPTWQGIQFDTDRGIKPPHAFAIVEVPDDEVDARGKIKRGYLKIKYAGAYHMFEVVLPSGKLDVWFSLTPSKWLTHTPDIGDETPA